MFTIDIRNYEYGYASQPYLSFLLLPMFMPENKLSM